MLVDIIDGVTNGMESIAPVVLIEILIGVHNARMGKPSLGGYAMLLQIWAYEHHLSLFSKVKNNNTCDY